MPLVLSHRFGSTFGLFNSVNFNFFNPKVRYLDARLEGVKLVKERSSLNNEKRDNLL